MAGQGTRTAAPAYRERLVVPWWWVVAGLFAAGLMAAEVHLGAAGVRSWLPYVVLLPAVPAAALLLSRIRVTVTGEEFHADDAHIPREFLLAAEALPRRRLSAALGPGLDPVAFVVHRPWIPTAVRIYLDDPADPTPYWIVSTRRPDALLAALDLPGPAAG